MLGCVGVGVVMPLPAEVVVAGVEMTLDGMGLGVTGGGVEELVDDEVDDGVDDVGATGGSPKASTQYAFPVSRLGHVAEGFCHQVSEGDL